MEENKIREPDTRTLIWIYLGILGSCLVPLFLGLKFLLLVGGGMAECYSTYTIETWVDGNSNGAWDEGEPPLPDVKFFIAFDTPQPPQIWGENTTDHGGQGEFGGMANVNMMKDFGDTLIIYTQVPAGYSRTTPESYPARVCSHGTTYSFGFLAKLGEESGP